ncbi:alpha-hydroxy acid oxidase [Candidatus Rariloculus sp.]|uniref:alpha-hydroxy acid oxidase n=1 Tax=Candidatus Rariloculus sp. TaxID=3101265 RepID=UPI003D138E81
MRLRRSERESRRALLRFIASSPLAYGLGAGLLPRGAEAQLDELLEALIESPEQALNVFDFQEYVKVHMPTGHYWYMAQGADDQRMLTVNREGFTKIQLRARRLIDTSNVDTSVELFGQRYDSPVFIAPCGALATFHPEGELAVARAAGTANTLQILSTVTNNSVEDVTEARGAPLWYQLYPTSDWTFTRAMIKRAEDAGCTALALTVDIPARNLEPIARFRRDSNEECQACHQPGFEAAFSTKAMFADADLSNLGMGIRGLTWDYVDRLKDATSMNVLVKGIVTGEDAGLCLEHGADGIIVSNHGSRAEDSGRSSIECLPEVLDAVDGRVPVVVDSGFRRGTDVFKALALGASGICIGKPYIWGLGAFGQPGVERVLAILNRELRIVMQQMGTVDIASITASSIQA